MTKQQLPAAIAFTLRPLTAVRTVAPTHPKSSVTRYGYGLIETQNKDRDDIVISRAGVAYKRAGNGTIRRIGAARVVGRNSIQVIPATHVRGKAARKAEKRARIQRREQDARRGRAIEAGLSQASQAAE